MTNTTEHIATEKKTTTKPTKKKAQNMQLFQTGLEYGHLTRKREMEWSFSVSLFTGKAHSHLQNFFCGYNV